MLEMLILCQRRHVISVFPGHLLGRCTENNSMFKGKSRVYLVTLSFPGESANYLDFTEGG